MQLLMLLVLSWCCNSGSETAYKLNPAPQLRVFFFDIDHLLLQLLDSEDGTTLLLCDLLDLSLQIFNLHRELLVLAEKRGLLHPDTLHLVLSLLH